MVLSCLRCMASEEDSGTVMKRSCQPSLRVNSREGKVVQACSWQGESGSGDELGEAGMLLPPLCRRALGLPGHLTCLRSLPASPVVLQPFVGVKGEVASSDRRLLTAADSCWPVCLYGVIY